MCHPAWGAAVVPSGAETDALLPWRAAPHLCGFWHVDRGARDVEYREDKYRGRKMLLKHFY